jgi:hypothetical protein
MVESKAKEGQAPTVKVDGEEAVLHITDQSVMFEKGGKVTGFLRSAVQMVKPDGDAMLIAYNVGNEVKSIRVEPMTAAMPLLVSGLQQSSLSTDSKISTSATALDEVFEKLYRDARKELEERLAKVQGDPANKSLRLTPAEEERYATVSRQMEDIAGTKHGFNPREDAGPLSFWGLEKQPHYFQVDAIKIRHISFLRDIVSPRAEIADIGYVGENVWPEDYERILVNFKLVDGPFLTEKFKSYLKSKWTKPEGNRKPVLAYHN